MIKVVQRVKKPLTGSIEIPADKSISHRAVIFASLTCGETLIKNFSHCEDCIRTLEIFKQMGIEYEFREKNLIIKSRGVLQAPLQPLDCGNSGTAMRLLAGLLAGQNFDTTLIGDESLSKRPMKRVIDPLSQMGAKIESIEGHAPLTIHGTKLHGIEYSSPIASAQVKSAILLASLFAEGNTTVTEPSLSRNHTELMLEYMGGKLPFAPKEISVPGDISSAAFFLVATLIVPNSVVILTNVGLNPTRTGIFDVIEAIGGSVDIMDEREVSGELRGDIVFKSAPLNGFTVEGDLVPRLIDEIPVIALLATQAYGKTVIKDAQDLRNKESDRILAVVSALKSLGAEIEETADGIIIQGKTPLTGGVTLNAQHDHRLAMMFYLAGLISRLPVKIEGFEWVSTSFPEFESLMKSLQ